MDATIRFTGKIGEEDSYALNELAEALSRDGLINHLEKSLPQSGRKDGGLTVAIALTGLALSAIGTLVSVLSHWRTSRPKYNVSITRGEVTLVVENLTPAQVQEYMTKLAEAEAEVGTVVQITAG